MEEPLYSQKNPDGGIENEADKLREFSSIRGIFKGARSCNEPALSKSIRAWRARRYTLSFHFIATIGDNYANDAPSSEERDSLSPCA